MLKVEGLNAGYGSVNILWDIGFEVKDGEIVAILGSNGAGKTTMVRTITGMVKASSGKVEFNGEDLSGKSSRVILDSGIVQVPEGRQLFTEMTVLENLDWVHSIRRPRHILQKIWKSAITGSPNCASAQSRLPALCPAASSRWWPWPVR